METLTYYEILSLQQANRQFYLDLIIAIVTFISVLLFYIDYRSRKSKERAEKSINIAEEFANSIIPKLSIIFGYFEKTKLNKMLNTVKFINFTDFDADELLELYSEDIINNYKEILSKNKTIVLDNKNVNIEDVIILTLNQLEHMCMYISTKVADERYIYNSLHQQFLKAISLLYISISLINTDNKDKYYTNIIEVFNIWKNKYIKCEKKERKVKKKLKPSIQKIK